MTTPARTPTLSTPRTAAIEIQKSARFTRPEAAHLGDIHHPEDDGVDDDHREHGFGQVREEWRQEQQGQDHHRARHQGGDARAGPGGVGQ